MLRISTPRLVMLQLFSTVEELAEDCVSDNGEYCKLASVEIGTPSTINCVPREDMEN